MLVAYELKMTLSELYERVDHDEMGWWLAFIKRKQQVEEQEAEKVRKRRGRK